MSTPSPMIPAPMVSTMSFNHWTRVMMVSSVGPAPGPWMRPRTFSCRRYAVKIIGSLETFRPLSYSLSPKLLSVFAPTVRLQPAADHLQDVSLLFTLQFSPLGYPVPLLHATAATRPRGV